jgi:predicted small metal-binding protein
MAFAYRCADFPGMEKCPGSFTAETEAELWKHVELHARDAHGENPAAWSAEDKKGVKDAIQTA